MSGGRPPGGAGVSPLVVASGLAPLTVSYKVFGRLISGLRCAVSPAADGRHFALGLSCPPSKLHF